LRALLRSKRFADENPQAARAIIVAAMKEDPGVFDTIGSNYRFVVQLDQSLLIMLEDQARWAIEHKLTGGRTTMPNFFGMVAADALTAVNHDAVTIVR
jgi:NitT/TauT family transport system substrate-binding protein